MTRKTCARTRRSLTAFCDGELSIAEQIRIEGHLRECAHCRDEVLGVRTLGEMLREHAAETGSAAVDDLTGLQISVVSRVKAERAQALSVRIGALFEDMHLVWTALSAVGAATACAVVVMGMFYFGWRAERRDSLAAVLSTVAPPPAAMSVPAVIDGRLVPGQQYPGDAVSAVVINSEEDAVLALAAVVTREGRIGHPDLAARHLLDQLSNARFDPARSGGSPLAVNMLWLFAHTTVHGKPHLPPKIGATFKRPPPPALA